MILPSSDLIAHLEKALASHLIAPITESLTEKSCSMIVLHTHAASLCEVITYLRDNPLTQAAQLTDICGADYPEEEARFEVVYHLLSIYHNIRFRVKISLEEEASLSSVTSLYPAANWYEREVWDMYGIFFENHPDLRRILTDYGFQGFPLRKDFPLTGYVEVRYDIAQKRVIYEPVKLDQAFRNFDFVSPWEGPHYTLPGDEKALPTQEIKKG